MEVDRVREDNMYNALAEVTYRLSLDKYGPDSTYETSSSPIHYTMEWDKDSPNGRSNEVTPKSRTNFIKMFLQERPQG